MNQKIAFFDTKPYDKKTFAETNKDFGFEINFFETQLNPQTAALGGNFDGVCVFVRDKVDRHVIDHLVEHGVEVIGLRCSGYNNVDFKAAYNKIHVVRVPAYSPHAIAEHAAALILSLNRKTHKAYYRVRDGNFSINGLLGFDLHGKTAGIIGTGRIGKCLISILKGFGMNVLAFDAYPDEEYAKNNEIRYTSLAELYEKSDIISLHCPLNKETEHMIDAKAIDHMKKGVMIINTGRGKLINTNALIHGLTSEKIGSAGLDVYEEESEYFFEDKSTEIITDVTLARLITFPNVLITSHQAFFTQEAIQNIALKTLSNFKEFFEGGYLKNEICYKCDKPCLKKSKMRCFQ
jgi:D-lactate dehydrogenase